MYLNTCDVCFHEFETINANEKTCLSCAYSAKKDDAVPYVSITNRELVYGLKAYVPLEKESAMFTLKKMDSPSGLSVVFRPETLEYALVDSDGEEHWFHVHSIETLRTQYQYCLEAGMSRVK